ncbi:MAG: MBL fold metallo-hydrolase [Gammaproteobacteria bacterium]|nr:MBL fold metallo-hydrolase [Gammaproteobacteria bacterium]
MTAFGPELPPFSELGPGLRRLVAPNPSMMTGPGTNTYLLGERRIAVLDPGPVIARHIAKIQDVAGAPIRWVLVTHTHPDHSPAAAKLAKATGAELLGRPPPEGPQQDKTFIPDRVLDDDDELATEEFVLRAVRTPGHASNHICYLHTGMNLLFTGDHVIDGSTVVINPPDGNMTHYLQSLRKIRALRCAALAPGHGEIIDDPDHAIDWTIDHRLERERKVADALAANPGLTARELVPHVYKDLDTRLYRLAERSLLAHLLKLEDDGLAGDR